MNPALEDGTAVRGTFADLPDRERPIAACSFRAFLLDTQLDRSEDAVPGLDVGVGLRDILSGFGMPTDLGALRSAHRVARDYYAYGVIFTKLSPDSMLRVEDPARFVGECLARDPSLGNYTAGGETGESSIAALLALSAKLAVVSRYDSPLDDAFVLKAEVRSEAPAILTGRNAQAVTTFLGEASTVFSEAMYTGYREFKEYFDRLVPEEHVAAWLEENGVEVYVRGQSFNLVATRSGTPRWWDQG